MSKPTRSRIPRSSASCSVQKRIWGSGGIEPSNGNAGKMDRSSCLHAFQIESFFPGTTEKLKSLGNWSMQSLLAGSGQFRERGRHDMTLARPYRFLLRSTRPTDPVPRVAGPSRRSARLRRLRTRHYSSPGFFDFLLPNCPRCIEPVSGSPTKCPCCHETLEGNPAWELSRKNSAWVLLIGPITVLAAVLTVWPRT